MWTEGGRNRVIQWRHFETLFAQEVKRSFKQSHKSFNPQVFYHLGSFFREIHMSTYIFPQIFLALLFWNHYIVKVIHIRPIRWKSLAFVWVSQAFWRFFSVQGCTALAWARRKRFGGPYWPARLAFGLSWVKAGWARLAHLFR